MIELVKATWSFLSNPFILTMIVLGYFKGKYTR